MTHPYSAQASRAVNARCVLVRNMSSALKAVVQQVLFESAHCSDSSDAGQPEGVGRLRPGAIVNTLSRPKKNGSDVSVDEGDDLSL